LREAAESLETDGQPQDAKVLTNETRFLVLKKKKAK
jgi:hypothetical protein